MVLLPMVKLAIIGTGNMAASHARAYSKIEDCKVTAACDIVEERAADFARKHGIPSIYTEVEALLAKEDCDAVVVVTPDPFHYSVTLQAIAAGKHVLCEKPLAVDYAEAAEMRDAAVEAGVINMVNFSYRNSSAIQMAAELAASGELGEIRHVHAHYLQSWLTQDSWGFWRTSPQWLWRLSKKHGSKGVLGDLGVHILDFASMPVGDYKSVHCKLKTFDKTEGNRVGEYDLDANDSAIITAEFSNGAIGSIHTTRWAYPYRNALKLDIYGDRASIKIDLDESYSELKINRILGRKPMDWEVLNCGETPNNFERFIAAVQSGKQDQPDFARGAQIQRVLDACEESDCSDKTVIL